MGHDIKKNTQLNSSPITKKRASGRQRKCAYMTQRKTHKTQRKHRHYTNKAQEDKRSENIREKLQIILGGNTTKTERGRRKKEQ